MLETVLSHLKTIFKTHPLLSMTTWVKKKKEKKKKHSIDFNASHDEEGNTYEDALPYEGGLHRALSKPCRITLETFKKLLKVDNNLILLYG